MKFSGITLVSDMDGTLLTNDKRITKKNMDAIRYFCSNGGNFTIASGRVYQSIESYFDQLEPKLPVISHNGGVICDPSAREVLYCRYLSGDYRNVVREIHKKFPWLGIEAFVAKRILFFTDNPYIRKHISDEKIFPDNQVVWHNLDDASEEWCKVLFACEATDADMLEQVLPPLYPQYQFVRSDAHYYELLPPGVNKGSALTELLRLCHLNRQTCYAVGDNMNDAELLEASGIGVAVKNASHALKERADIILPATNEEDAIAVLIEMIDKGTI